MFKDENLASSIFIKKYKNMQELKTKICENIYIAVKSKKQKYGKSFHLYNVMNYLNNKDACGNIALLQMDVQNYL